MAFLAKFYSSYLEDNLQSKKQVAKLAKASHPFKGLPAEPLEKMYEIIGKWGATQKSRTEELIERCKTTIIEPLRFQLLRSDPVNNFASRTMECLQAKGEIDGQLSRISTKYKAFVDGFTKSLKKNKEGHMQEFKTFYYLKKTSEAMLKSRKLIESFARNVADLVSDAPELEKNNLMQIINSFSYFESLVQEEVGIRDASTFSALTRVFSQANDWKSNIISQYRYEKMISIAEMNEFGADYEVLNSHSYNLMEYLYPTIQIEHIERLYLLSINEGLYIKSQMIGSKKQPVWIYMTADFTLNSNISLKISNQEKRTKDDS